MCVSCNKVKSMRVIGRHKTDDFLYVGHWLQVVVVLSLIEQKERGKRETDSFVREKRKASKLQSSGKSCVFSVYVCANREYLLAAKCTDFPRESVSLSFHRTLIAHS